MSDRNNGFRIFLEMLMVIFTGLTAYFLWQQLNLSRTELQPFVVGVEGGAECPSFLAKEAIGGVSEKQYIYFMLHNIGKSPTTVSVYIETHGVNATSDRFTSINKSVMVKGLVFDKDDINTYSMCLSPDVSMKPYPSEVSFRIFYTYSMVDGSISKVDKFNCNYILNESADKGRWIVFYNLKISS